MSGNTEQTYLPVMPALPSRAKIYDFRKTITEINMFIGSKSELPNDCSVAIVEIKTGIFTQNFGKFGPDL